MLNSWYSIVKFYTKSIITFAFLFTVSWLLAEPEEVHHVSKKYIAAPVTPAEHHWVDSVMNTLTPRERIAQMFMMAAYPNLDENLAANLRRDITQYKIGGLIFFQGAPERHAELVNQYQALSQVPLLIGIDAEWGVSMRMKEVSPFPKQMALGAINDDMLIYELGAEFARQCKLLGIHINFAPSVDVNNNAANPVINYRSFGENPERVANKGITLMRGMQDNGVMASAKHFPGHGDTDVDSHHALPELAHSRQRLDSLELVPFNRIIDSGVAMVMVGHLFVKALEDERSTVPSSISRNVIDGLLHKEMGFQGLVISDALNMKGLANNANGKNVALEALKAGHDILLMPNDVAKNLEAIEAAIAQGELNREDVENRCRKVLAAKYRAGLNVKPQALDTENLLEKLNSPEACALRNRLAQASITLIHNRDSLIPFMNLDKHKFGYLAVGSAKSGETFEKQLALYADFTSASISKAPTAVETEAAAKKLDNCDIIVVGYHSTLTSPAQNFGVNQAAMDFIARLGENKTIVLNYFGLPYFLSHLRNSPSAFCEAITVCYDNSVENQNRAAQMLFGGIAFTAKLPVTPTPEFPEGCGIETRSIERLSYLMPEELGISGKELNSIDSLARAAIERGAVPGCQVIAVHKGKVFYRKAFGHHTYEKATPVKLTDVYDIASLTKTSATLPLVMRMLNEGKLDLDKTLNNYISFYAGSDKGNLKIRDLLLHQSGLCAWIPFHFEFFTTPDKSPVFGKKSAEYTVQLPGTRRYINSKYRLDPELFSSKKSEVFSQPVAAGIFASNEVSAKVYRQMDTSKLMSAVYRYSDLGFLYMQRILETAYNISEDKLVQTAFFEPLGMYSTGFRPLAKIDKKRIPPTEDDKIFRRQLINGYVHDPGAALLGGVAGHAGLFACADDLAKLYQMYLNGGAYGGKRYISPEILTEFTACAACSTGNRRGLGFDKQEPDPKKTSPVCKEASLSRYGHTGFTGTMVWVDPERDLVYIFLSNRVYPTAENSALSKLNTRTEILAHLLKIIDRLKNYEL